MTNILNIINEEISEFDFLGHKSSEKEIEKTKPLHDEDFQKQFIIDSLENSNKISLDSVKVKLTGDWEDGNSDDLTVEYITNVGYKIDDNKSIEFKLKFEGDNIKYKANNPDDRWFNNIDLKNIDVDYYDISGKKINFDAFNKAPDKIKNLFVKKYVGDLFK